MRLSRTVPRSSIALIAGTALFIPAFADAHPARQPDAE